LADTLRKRDFTSV